MAEPTQYTFSLREILEHMVRSAGVTEGNWMIQVHFGFGAGNAGTDEEGLVPTAFVGVQKFGIVQVPNDGTPIPAALCVDAAQLAKQAP